MGIGRIQRLGEEGVLGVRNSPFEILLWFLCSGDAREGEGCRTPPFLTFWIRPWFWSRKEWTEDNSDCTV